MLLFTIYNLIMKKGGTLTKHNHINQINNKIMCYFVHYIYLKDEIGDP